MSSFFPQKDDYVIIKDIVKDKHSISSEDGDSYYIYCDYTFLNYNADVSIGYNEYNNINIGDECYLYAKKNSRYIYYACKCNEYELNDQEKMYLIECKDLPNYTKLKPIEKKFNDKYIVINKDRILDDLCPVKIVKRMSILSLILGVLSAYSIYKNINDIWDISQICIMLIFIFIFVFLATLVIGIRYIIYKNKIDKDNFFIKKHKIIGINETLQFRYKNRLIEFTLEGLEKHITRQLFFFPNVKIGDFVYIVYLNKDKPIDKLCYNANMSTLEIVLTEE